jgi:hypothetical protein
MYIYSGIIDLFYEFIAILVSKYDDQKKLNTHTHTFIIDY